MDIQAQAGRAVPAYRYLAAAPSFAASLLTTELFFKFGSFTLEFLGFAALWGGLYGLQSLAVRLLGSKS